MEWNVRRAVPLLGLFGSILVALVTVALLYIGLVTFSPSSTLGFLFVILVSGLVCLEVFAMVEWEERLYENRKYRSERTYPVTPERVDTAVGLLLASRRAEFERVTQKGGFWTPRGFRYQVSKLDDESMVITLRPREGGGTDLRLFSDIEDEGERAGLQAAIDAAVESPYELDLTGAVAVEEPPELHVFED